MVLELRWCLNRVAWRFWRVERQHTAHRQDDRATMSLRVDLAASAALSKGPARALIRRSLERLSLTRTGEGFGVPMEQVATPRAALEVVVCGIPLIARLVQVPRRGSPLAFDEDQVFARCADNSRM